MARNPHQPSQSMATTQSVSWVWWRCRLAAELLMRQPYVTTAPPGSRIQGAGRVGVKPRRALPSHGKESRLLNIVPDRGSFLQEIKVLEGEPARPHLSRLELV